MINNERVGLIEVVTDDVSLVERKAPEILSIQGVSVDLFL